MRAGWPRGDWWDRVPSKETSWEALLSLPGWVLISPCSKTHPLAAGLCSIPGLPHVRRQLSPSVGASELTP